VTEGIVREVAAPYTVISTDEGIGRDTIIIQRNGEPVAAILPYSLYQQLMIAHSGDWRPPSMHDDPFVHERAAYERLLPELLKSHRDEWVGFVDEQPVAYGPDFSAVAGQLRRRFGLRPIYVRHITDARRVYRIESPHRVRR
jgi:hypothetical protein